MNANNDPQSGKPPSPENSKPGDLPSPSDTEHSSGDVSIPDSMARQRILWASAIGVGSMLGPYELLEKLGQGGMGTVYKARQTRLKKIVALKVLAPAFLGNEQAQARFDREMEAVGKIDHPNIVRALDAGEFGGMHYLSMEYVEGTDLSKLVKERGPLSPANACHVIRQAAEGLAVAHEAGLVHRDVKPANMLLTADGRVKLLDLGLARITEADTKNEFTRSGQTFGTPDYMAPEQWEDSHNVDARADLYSLGCTLYFLLTGEAPYAEAQSFAAKLMAHVSSPPPALPTACPAAPAELIAIYQKLMAKSPAERISSARELVSLLAPLVPGGPDQASMPVAEGAQLGRKKAPSAWKVGALLLGGAGMVAALFGVLSGLRNDNGKTNRTPAKEKVVATATSVELPPIDYAAERKAAQWLAQRMTDGFFKVVKVNGEWVDVVRDNRTLPKEDFTLRQVQRIPEIDDEGLALLARCRRVTFVTLAPNPKLSLAGLQNFTDAAAPTLAILNLEVSHEIQDHLVSLLGRKPFPALHQISASDIRAASAWENSPPLPSLEVLDIPGAPLNANSLKTICDRYSKLKSLGIPYGANVSTTDLRPLASLRSLRRLVSSSFQWSEPNIAVLKDLPQFEALVVSSPVADPPGSLQKLAPLADKLTDFELFVWADGDPGPSDADYDTILQFRKLQFLKLSGQAGSPTDNQLAEIAKLPLLQKFSIRFDPNKRRYTAEGINAFLQARPDVVLEVDGKEVK